MNSTRSFIVTLLTVAATALAGCSSNEAAPKPVPVDGGVDSGGDAATKGDAEPDHVAADEGEPGVKG